MNEKQMAAWNAGDKAANDMFMAIDTTTGDEGLSAVCGFISRSLNIAYEAGGMELLTRFHDGIKHTFARLPPQEAFENHKEQT